ncbi:MAG: chorismate-binding protein [Bacteroidales bacterium]|jgi:isochorismate synthase|nr:chorismate-binding protein [Bacteroidales bacterium]MCK9447451.1 chorismate-binding protein [Bacteroidales bacterium]MDD3700675.1 chorismate-binding protein [Bacteroidales bacterium]MDY0370471.1 chorismate-binding protein [Bacteroidales bacterium]
MKLADAINHALKTGLPFVCYRLPDQAQPVSAFKVKLDTRPDQATPYFVMAPYDNSEIEYQYVALLECEVGFEISTDILHLSNAHNQPDPSPILEGKLWTESDYLKAADQLIQLMQKGKANKIVLSRQLETLLPSHKYWGEVFTDLCKTYPNAFAYCFSDGTSQQWMGASPETLLRVQDSEGETMALASTQAAGQTTEDQLQWGQKEIDEHAFVIYDIREKLRILNVTDLRETEVFTTWAGPVAHLKCMFNFRMPDSVTVDQLAETLHPTPAICGTPTKSAQELIREFEPHQRLYYTGYAGIRKHDHSASYFVNLRCMRIIGNKALLYVGGGLTADSGSRNEWEETLLKASVLQSVIAK